MFISDSTQWLKDHANEWWHDALNLITNDTQSTPNLSQQELAFTILMLFALFLSSMTIVITMFKRYPVLFLDKSLLAREIGYVILFGVTLYVFYSQTMLNFYVRNGIYSILLVSSFFVILSTIRENRMTSEEVEQERQEEIERRHLDGYTHQRQT